MAQGKNILFCLLEELLTNSKQKNGEYEDTLILVTADHAHSFDVWGTIDQNYIRNHNSNGEMRNSIGTYARAGFPGYFDKNNDGFPDNFVSA